MIFHIFTIFPDVFEEYFKTSIIGRAQKNGLVKIKIYDIRKFAEDKHKTTDDRPYGGGAGMVMKAEPIIRAVDGVIKKLKGKKRKIIILSAKGKQFTQKEAYGWSKICEDILLICGRYEGIDERVKKALRAQEISIGPYVLTGGELPAMVVVDAVSRHIRGVLGKEESLEEIKGSYPVCTRPEVLEYKSKKYRVPKVLLSGDHKKIESWRKSNSKSV